MNKTAAILIAFFLGGLGVHRFMALWQEKSEQALSGFSQADASV